MVEDRHLLEQVHGVFVMTLREMYFLVLIVLHHLILTIKRVTV